MSQLSFFDSPRQETDVRPANPDFIRKHLNAVLRLMRRAERMPWNAGEARNWRKQFPELAKLLPPEEGERYQAEFNMEWDRLSG